MNFDQAIEIILYLEGGAVDNPSDPGGETKYGISKKSYPGLNISSLTMEDAVSIYRSDYWDALGLDDFPNLLRLPVFDSAVNQGISYAVKELQKTLGLNPDGVIGPLTKKSLGECDDRETRKRFMLRRIDHYTRLETWQAFSRGWARRLLVISLSE